MKGLFKEGVNMMLRAHLDRVLSDVQGVKASIDNAKIKRLDKRNFILIGKLQKELNMSNKLIFQTASSSTDELWENSYDE